MAGSPQAERSGSPKKIKEVPSVYRWPYGPDRPVVCMNEMPRQLIEEVRKPIPPKPGRGGRQDHHYQCN
jgi:hypothetical protein